MDDTHTSGDKGRDLIALSTQAGHRMTPPLLVITCILSWYSCRSLYFLAQWTSTNQMMQHNGMLYRMPFQNSLYFPGNMVRHTNL